MEGFTLTVLADLSLSHLRDKLINTAVLFTFNLYLNETMAFLLPTLEIYIEFRDK